MKEILLKFLNSGLFDTLLGQFVIAITPVFIFLWGKATKQFKFQRDRLENKYRDITPNWLEPIVDKIASKVMNYTRDKAEEFLLEELRKHSIGQESDAPTKLKLALKEITDNSLVAVKESFENNLKKEIEEKVVDKALEITKVVSNNLLDKAKVELVNRPAYGLDTLKDSVDNKSVISIIDRLKDLPKDKNFILQAYGEVQKQDGKELEGKLCGSITGMI